MMMTRRLAILLLLATTVTAAGTPRQRGQIIAGTDVGKIGVKIALPEFQAATGDPKTVQLAAVFNKVLSDDLDYSGGITVINKSFYPIGKFSGPADIKPE